jgi:hypothetical protein
MPLNIWEFRLMSGYKDLWGGRDEHGIPGVKRKAIACGSKEF